MKIVNHRMPVAVPILSAVLLSMSMIVSNMPPAEASQSHTYKVNQQQSGTQPNPTKQDNNGNQQQSGTQPNPTKHDNNGNQQQSGTQDSSTRHPHKSDRHTNDKQAGMNQRVNQLDQCTNGAACWNWAQNIMCVKATCIFGGVTPFLLPWQKEIIH
jgi:cytoskeletal protein RodZ